MKVLYLDSDVLSTPNASPRRAIVQAIQAAGAVFVPPIKSPNHPLSFDSKSADGSGQHERFKLLRQRVAMSDAVIVEATDQDFLLGYTTALALQYDKPVLCLSQTTNYETFIDYPLFRASRYQPGEESQHVEAFLARVSRDMRPYVSLSKSNRNTLQSPTKNGKTILAVGGLYVDIFTGVDRLPQENEIAYSDSIDLELGGKASNTAVGLARLGNSVQMYGKAGNDPLAYVVESQLLSEDVATDGVDRDNQLNTGVVVLNVTERAKFSTIVHEAANTRLETARFDSVFERLQPDALYITLEPQPDFIEHVLREASEKTLVMCDASPQTRLLDKKLYRYIDFLAPNETEAEHMTGMKVQTVADAFAAALQLRRDGAKNVIITLGRLGSVLLEEHTDTPLHVSAYTVPAVNEVGCGDAFRAAFLTKYLETKDALQAMRYATKAGAIVALKSGASKAMPMRYEVDSFSA